MLSTAVHVDGEPVWETWTLPVREPGLEAKAHMLSKKALQDYQPSEPMDCVCRSSPLSPMSACESWLSTAVHVNGEPVWEVWKQPFESDECLRVVVVHCRACERRAGLGGLVAAKDLHETGPCLSRFAWKSPHVALSISTWTNCHG